MKICIDAGHGGNDSGATYNSRKEKNDVLKIALKVKEFLEFQKITVIMTRTTDIEQTIEKRCKIANDNNVDYFISIHRNSGGGKGVESWVHSQATTNTYNKAKIIIDEIIKICFSNRGVKKGAINYTDYGINKYSNAPSCLLELGFIDSKSDNDLLDKNFNKICEAIAKGICKMLGVDYKVSTNYVVQTAKINDKNSFVLASKMLIDLCNNLGFCKTKVNIDGGFGTGTQNAVKEIQKFIGMKETGIINDDLIKNMRALIASEIKEINNLNNNLNNKIIQIKKVVN